MTSNAPAFSAPKAFLTLAVVAASFFAPLLPAVQAQQVYRIVGADGKVTFSDRPPPAASGANVSSASANAAGVSAAAGLPFELRQVASKYPVTLYTGDNCVPCSSGRSLLTSRGIPFAEKTVTTAEDSQALQRMSGETSLPFVTIGSQQLKGFSDAEWTQYLNAAGYPATSALPTSYRAPAPAPLISIAAAPAPTAATGESPAAGATAGTTVITRPARPARPAVQPNSGNPAGIQF